MDKNIVPDISIVMPVYNGLPYLPQAIESILSQTFINFEFIIINDASKDRSLEVIRSYSDPRIKIIDNPKNLHLISSLNIGLRAAQGKYVARMDQDDISFPERLNKQYDFLQSHPDVILVGTWSNIMNSVEKFIKVHKNPLRSNVLKYELMFGNTITHPSIMFRKEAIQNIGGYGVEWINTEDYNLYSRLIRSHKLANIGEPLINYRVHKTSLTNEKSSQVVMHENTKKIIRENISHYITLSDSDHQLITQVLIARHADSKLPLSLMMRAQHLHREIYLSFLQKESAHLDTRDKKEIRVRYIARRNLLFKKYLVGKYHLLTHKNA